MFQKILGWFKRPKKNEIIWNYMEDKTNKLVQGQEGLLELVVALSRLTFVKPEVMDRERKNVKANAEFILKMIEKKGAK